MGIPCATARRRTILYPKFYHGIKRNSAAYLSMDVPVIAHRYLSLWAGMKMTSSNLGRTCRRSFHPEDLEVIEGDFRLILMCSNIIRKIQIVNNSVVASLRDGFGLSPPRPRVVAASPSLLSSATSHPQNRRARAPLTATPDTRSPFPSRATPSGADAPANENSTDTPSAESTSFVRLELPDKLRRKSLLCMTELGATRGGTSRREASCGHRNTSTNLHVHRQHSLPHFASWHHSFAGE